MLSISNSTLKALVPFIIIFGIIYLIIYKWRNPDSNLFDYFIAFQGYLALLFVLVFIVVGIGITIEVIKQGIYFGLIIPIGWGFICYFVIKKLLLNFFHYDLKIIKINLSDQTRLLYKNVGISLILLFFAFICFAMTYIMFVSVIPDTENLVYGAAPIIMISLLLFFTGILLTYISYKTITKNIYKHPAKKTTPLKQFVNKNRTEIILYPMMILIGLVFIVVGISIFKGETNFINSAGETEGIITSITKSDDDYYVSVRFNVEEKEYSGNLNFYDFTMYEGKKITIYYDKNNPNNFISKSLNWFPLLFILLGGIPMVIGIININKLKIEYKKFKIKKQT